MTQEADRNEMLDVPTVQAELTQADDSQQTPMAKARCPHCEHEAVYGLPVMNVAFTVGCVNCKLPFTITPPVDAYSASNGA
ncbi:MAG: hypothetical protein WKH64_12450 [Chloroflexia bacterium]